ncbi:MAG: hypothetical protein SGI72_11920 [Planctomycetota bacterium]|nr:hypothetical protein [Planctomycetota bacterium]
MRFESNGPRGRPDEVLAPHTADDALLRWDDLDEQLLRMLAEDPERGWRLRKLQDADGWLRSRASDVARKASGPALLVCPPPEDLYDFGQGPGASSLSADRRASIDRHLATCLECERFVETLESAPPSPLIFGLPVEEELEEEPTPVVPPRRRGLRLVPLLASAAAAVLLFLAVRAVVTPETLRFPEAPLLRGSAGGAVHYPRGRVLLPSAEVALLFPSLSAPLRLEVEPQAEGGEYRFIYSRLEGGAIGRDTKVDEIVSTSPTAESKWLKEPGRFTLTAWVTHNGLYKQLGKHDFQVVADLNIEANLLALAERSPVERTLAAVHVLHAAGYVTDAHELARTLPPSVERDRYLDQVPGR